MTRTVPVTRARRIAQENRAAAPNFGSNHFVTGKGDNAKT